MDARNGRRAPAGGGGRRPGGPALVALAAALACSPPAPSPAGGGARAAAGSPGDGGRGDGGRGEGGRDGATGPGAGEGGAGRTGEGGGEAGAAVALAFGPGEVARALFDAAEAPGRLASCRGAAGGEAACLLGAAYSSDPEALGLARALYERTGSVAGVEDAQVIDGGYRGPVRLEPALPLGPHRKHLAWAAAAFDEFDRVLGGGAAGGPAARFRTGPVVLRYYRSVGKRTPNAYAAGRQIAYNVVGSINRDAGEVRDTLFHELFHLNDAEHGDWSARELGALYDGIVRRCGASAPCLGPYAPNGTKVRGGTYYAFQPGNGVGEYGAELAVRYLRERREAARGAVRRPFKCGPAENARAWAALAREFFGGADPAGPCP